MAAVTMVLIAYGAPAAQADYWVIGGKKLGGAGAKVALHTAGVGKYKIGGLIIGPCNLLDKDVLWNGETMGEGERTIWGLELPCGTNVPGCKVVAANPLGLPWPITLLAKGETEVKAKIGFTFENSPGCKAIGLGGLTVTFEGVIPGMFNNSTSCLDSEEESGLTSPLGPVLYSGEDCFEVESGEEGEGEPLTVEE